MVACGYIFDIIIVRIDAPNTQFEDPALLTVDAVFNKIPLNITSSRINVVEFRSGSSYEFESSPEDLKKSMKMNPLKLNVKYKDSIIGSGEFEWPDSVLDRISECVGEVTHMDECELQNDDVKVGNVEIIVRLQTKCQEIADGEGFIKTCDDIRKQLNKIINPHDVLFVVGEGNKDNMCAALLPQVSKLSNEAQHATALDLSRYRNMNGKLVQTPDILNTCGNVECCELKKISNEYQKLIDTLMALPGGEGERSSKCSKVCAVDNALSESNSSSTKDSSGQKFSCTCFAAQHDKGLGAFEGEKLMNICPQESPPELQQTVYSSKRKCPVCKENLAWLPKLAPCPRCGYKPVPFADEKPYDPQLTADQILHEYLEKHSSSTDNKVDEKENDNCREEQKECRCTCRNGKICAHCRIRKLCEDIFQSNSGGPFGDNSPDECGKCETKSSQDIYNICKTSSKDCRPYLARVFSELRELYNIKETKRKGFEVNKRCENVLNKIDTDKKGQSQSKKKKQNLNKSQNKSQTFQDINSISKIDRDEKNTQASKKSKGKCRQVKKYIYKSIRRSPGSQFGHQTCVNGFAAGRKNVPRNMGWLWNVDTEGPRRGWKPGAIRKSIKCLMKYFLKDFPADTLRVSQYSSRKKCKDETKEEEELIQKPTLHICKKNDEYFITLRPLKDAEALRHCADPYLNMKPIQFKITKNPLLNELRKLKRFLKEMGFAKCTCHKPVSECYCRSFLDKKRLEYQVNKECHKRCLPCCGQNLVLSDTTDSDVEFDFGVTPPAGIIKPELAKKPNVVHHGTQYVQGDWNVVPLFPKPPNKYVRHYDCATGGKYEGAGGRGGKGKGGRGGGGNTGGRGGGAGSGRGGGRGNAGGGRGGGTAGAGGRGGASGSGAGGGGGGGASGGAGGAAAGKGGGKSGGTSGKGAAGDKSANRERGGTAGTGKGANAGTGKGANAGINKYFGDKGKSSASEERKKRLRALCEMPPPLICMVDRRRKPVDTCAYVCDDVCGPIRDPCCFSQNICGLPRVDSRIC